MSGEAAQGRPALRRTRRVLHVLVRAAIGVTVLAAAAAALLGWRLSQGPLELPWLAREIAAQASALSPLREVTIGGATLAWEGLDATDRPLDIRVTDVRVRERGGETEIAIPEAAVSLSLRRLLLGQIAPRAILLRRPRVSLVRGVDGAISVAFDGEEDGAAGDAGAAQALLADLSQPPGGPSRFARFRRLRIIEARLTVIDRALGATWRVPDVTLDIVRLREGGLRLAANLDVRLGEVSTHAAVTGRWADATGLELNVDATPVRPAVLAHAAPALAPLAALDAPLGGQLTLRLDPAFALRAVEADLALGAGTATLPEDTVAFDGAAVRATWDGETLAVREASLRLAEADGHPGPVLRLSGEARRRPDGGYDAGLHLGADAIAVAPLPRWWPQGVAPNPRAWLTENLVDGVVRDFTVVASVHVPADLDPERAELLFLSGEGRAEEVTVYWLRPVPPIADIGGTVALNESEVSILSRGGGTGALRVGDGRIVITGLDAADQFLYLEAPVSGPVPDVLALLAHPRLKLFEKRPLDLKNPRGEVTAQVSVGLPLLKDLDLDMLDIRASGKLEAVQLGDVVLGRNLDAGAFDFAVDPAGLQLSGSARVGGIPARITVAEDFTAGPPTQVVSRQGLTAKVDAGALAGFGADVAPFVTGPLGVDAQAQTLRNGQQRVGVNVDLAGARLAIDDLAWAKAAGVPARAEATVALTGGRISGIDPIRVDGTGVAVRGRAVAGRDGRIERLVFDQVRLGDSDVSGEVVLPAGGGPLAATVRGAQLDLSARLARGGEEKPAATDVDAPGLPWEADARLGRVLLGRDRALHDVALNARSDGRAITSAHATGRTGPRDGAFEVTIAPRGGRRTLRATAADAGALLRGFDVIDRMHGGKLALDAAWDDSKPGRPLSGAAEISEFVIRDAPSVVRLLQAMTLYGLVDALRADGLRFSQLTAPFTLTGDTLALGDSRAFSASLGLTAKGQLDLAAHRIDLTGTIVPAYFFNSLLGNIPLIGRLFSPEPGSGLFAARYTVRGSLDDPEVSVNPLSALTPGFLRGLFGIFDGGEAPPAAEGAPADAAPSGPPRIAPPLPQTHPDGGGG